MAIEEKVIGHIPKNLQKLVCMFNEIMPNYNEDETDYENQITYKDLNVGKDSNILNIKNVSKVQFTKKLSNTEAELKKALLIKKACKWFMSLFRF